MGRFLQVLTITIKIVTLTSKPTFLPVPELTHDVLFILSRQLDRPYDTCPPRSLWDLIRHHVKSRMQQLLCGDTVQYVWGCRYKLASPSILPHFGAPYPLPSSRSQLSPPKHTKTWILAQMNGKCANTPCPSPVPVAHVSHLSPGRFPVLSGSPPPDHV